MKNVTHAAVANGAPYWMVAGDSSIAPESARQPVTAEQIDQAEADLSAKAARRYYGTCAECGDPATYGEIDGVKLCAACADFHNLQLR